jgi:hypothetical protein
MVDMGQEALALTANSPSPPLCTNPRFTGLKDDVATAADIVLVAEMKPALKLEESAAPVADAITNGAPKPKETAKRSSSKDGPMRRSISPEMPDPGATREEKMNNQESITKLAAKNDTQASNDAADQEKKEQQELHDMLLKIFHELDGDNSGCIAREELGEALEAVGVSPARTMKLLRTADSDGSGEIDIAEWKKAVEAGANKEMKQSLAKLCERHNSEGGIFASEKVEAIRDPLMIHPASVGRVAWDFAMAGLLAYVAVVSPFFASFGDSLDASGQKSVETFEFLVDCAFMVDVVLNFRTGYVAPDGELVMQGRLAALHYLRTWCLLDVVSSVPLDRFMDVSSTRFMKILKIGKIARVFHVLKPQSNKTYARAADLFYDTTSSFFQRCIRRSGIIVSTCLLTHWLACFMRFSGAGYLEEYQDVSGSMGKEYLAALYWSMTTLTTVGYGDITPGSDMERVCAMIAMVIGGSFYGYVIGIISSVVANQDLNQAAYYEKMDLVAAWIDAHDFPKKLRILIRRWFRMALKQKSAAGDTEIYGQLSPSLQEDVCRYLIKDEVIHNPLFDGLAISVIVRMQKLLRMVSYDEGRCITKAGESGSAMYMIIDGKIVKDHEGQPQMKLRHGDSFGEELLFGLREKYEYTTKPECDSTLYMIIEEDFQDCFRMMPDVIQKMTDNFLEMHGSLFLSQGRVEMTIA